MEKYDKTIYGVIAGLILTVIGYLISYPVKTRGLTTTFEQYWHLTWNGSDQQDILIFCLIPNMFFFYFTTFRWNTYNLTKGLVGVTLVIVLALFALVL